MDCETASSLIAREVDGALDAAGQQALVAHAARCSRCAEAREAHAEVARLLHARPAAPLPPGFAERLARRLDAEAPPKQIDWRLWTARALPFAALLLLATGLVEARGPRETTLARALDAWSAPTVSVTTASQEEALEQFLVPAEETSDVR
jgi:anti-sigma factor RsiW